MAKKQTEADQNIGPPDLWHSFTEAARATFELCTMQAFYPALTAFTPDNHPRTVLVLPGFGAGDITTHQLRRFLDAKGHKTFGWERGINTGPSRETFEHLKRRLHDVATTHSDSGKVTLIGHSLGGVYAREMGRAFPDMVEQVVTLGSPFGAGMHPQSTSAVVRKAFAIINGADNHFLKNHHLAHQSLTPPPVPTTSIYTRSDGVVHWKTCINPKVRRSENVEVRGSHIGLVFNPLALIVMADRLAQSPQSWTPFAHDKYSPFLFSAEQAHHGYTPGCQKHPKPLEPVHLFK